MVFPLWGKRIGMEADAGENGWQKIYLIRAPRVIMSKRI